MRWAPAALAVLAVGYGGPSAAGTEPVLTHDAPFTIASFPAADSVPAAVAASESATGSATEQVADPARVAVPRLGISAALSPLSLGADGELIPPDYGSAGWYRNGPEPGETGRAVIAGHVDSRTGPDVFADLRNARPGDRIVVDLVDGTAQEFVVDDVGLYAKSAFPTADVYGPSTERELRLITCGGEYDRDRGGYQSNVVVFAHAVG
ncbi:class F sortase [Sporichthya brevicatena]|uniref:Class F sortase n=1 Tax=Sporichthya brevicatena TaxID=171442 RepID=A0ABN1H8A3_9ACTN